MQFHKLTVNVTLATLAVAATQCAATVALQSATHASTKYDFIAKQVGLQTAQTQASQTESPSENTSITPERQTFFSDPPQLIRSAASQTGGNTPSTYEFTLTVPKDAGNH